MPKHLSPMSYKEFDLDRFKEEKIAMETFRRNTYGEQMEKIWQALEEAYIPSNGQLSKLSAKWTLNDDDTATLSSYLFDSDGDDTLKFNEPLVGIKVHSGLSILTQRTPDVKWDSNSNLYNDRTPVLNALRSEDWMDDQVRQQYTMMWFYNFIYGTTYWRRYYDYEEREVSLPVSINLADDEIEYDTKTMIDTDIITGEALDPLQVWIDPATKPLSPRSMRKVLYTKVYDYTTFHRLFAETTTEKEDFKKIEPTSITGYANQELVKCEFYENKDLDLYYVVANDVTILKSHLPWNHKQLSVMMATWFPRGKKNPFGVGPVEMMMEDKRALDEFKSMTLTQVKFSIYKALFYQGSLTTDGGEGGDLRIRPDRAYKASDPKSITFYDMPGPGADAWRAISEFRARVDDASGINRPLGGEITGSTAFETDLAKDAALARLSVPIANVVSLLRKDAMLHFELQKQYYSLPNVKEMVDPDDIDKALRELQVAEAKGLSANFSIWIDEESEDNRVFRGDFRTAQLNLSESPTGELLPTEGKKEVVITPRIFDWRGKIHVVADSLLTITPTIDRRNKLEGFNIIIPMLSQPPELVAKPARELAKLYSLKIQDLFPEPWLQYLEQVDSGELPQPQQPQAQAQPQPGPNQGAEGELQFEQARAPQVVTNVGGQKDQISAQSQQLNPTVQAR